MKDSNKETIDNAAGAGTSDKIAGNAKKASGRVKEAAGALTGNDKLRAKGAEEQTEGAIQHAVGEVKKGVDDLLDKGKKALRKH